MKTVNKLVRDNIPKIIASQNKIPHFRKMESDAEYYSELCKKLQEETNEFLLSNETEELADIVEVIEAILKYKKIDVETLHKIKDEKAKANGHFDEKLFLISVE